MAQSYQDLVVWQRALELSLAIYRVTKAFPKEELYGLTSQMRRASVSVASNIAEGYGRGSRGEYKQFLSIARGSTLELQTQLIIANELSLISSLNDFNRVNDLANEVSKMLRALLLKL